MSSVSGAVDMALGTPQFPHTAEASLRAAWRAIRNGHNQYEVPAGHADLRESISTRFRADGGLDEVTVTVGATEALAATMLALVDIGDEVMVPEPYYPNFLSAIALAGGVPTFVRLRPGRRTLDLHELTSKFTPRTRMLLINSPHNPTGRVLSPEELRAVGDWCAEREVWLVSDEVYRDFVYDDNCFQSASDFEWDHAISIGSFSKSHAVSGWRVGYVRARSAATRDIRVVHETLTGCAPTPLQHALVGAVMPAETRMHMEQRRDRTLRIFRAAGLDCATPQGGCCFTATVPSAYDDAEQFVRDLAEETGVVLLPGTVFTSAGNPVGMRFVRIAFNRTEQTLDLLESRMSNYHFES